MTRDAPTSGATEPLIDRLRRATIGRYDIYAELGTGGMASVYLALDLALDRKVAIKVLSPALASAADNVTRFKREAKVAAALDHPNIIGILAVGDDPELAYFVMKYVEGSSLDSVIAAEGGQSVAFTRSVVATAGRALHYAHERRVVHRDVKPANLMLDLDGRLIVTDFGIAKQHDAQGLTMTGSVIGTPHYMSPEQFNGLPVTGATDQYALGVVAFEVLTGRQPYAGDTVGEVMRGHLFDPIPSARALRPDVPQAFDAVITRMLAKDAADRYASLSAAAEAIEAAAAADEAGVRTQIIELAKSGARARPEIRVPVSPAPAVRGAVAPAGARPLATEATRETPSSAPTVVMRRPRTSRPLWMALAVLAIAVGAAAIRPALSRLRGRAAEMSGPQLQTGSPTAAAPSAVAQDPEAVGVPAAADPERAAPGRSTPTSPGGRDDETAPAPVGVDPSGPAASGTRTNPGLRRQKIADALRTGARDPTAPPPVRPPGDASGPTPSTGTVVIRRSVAASQLLVNGVPHREASRLVTLTLPAGPVRLTIRSTRCAPWDSTVTVLAGREVRIGSRPLDCGGAP